MTNTMGTPYNEPAFASPDTAAIPASPASDGGIMTQSAFGRLEGQATQQQIANQTQLALTPWEYGTTPGNINPQTNPTAQDLHPSAQRLNSGQWQGKTSQLNHAQAAQDGSDVWVTVPVDKVSTRGPVSTSNPVYASTKGYVPRPGESGGSIPPVARHGRPLQGNAGFGL